MCLRIPLLSEFADDIVPVAGCSPERAVEQAVKTVKSNAMLCEISDIDSREEGEAAGGHMQGAPRNRWRRDSS